jgi:hypothetical protein
MVLRRFFQHVPLLASATFIALMAGGVTSAHFERLAYEDFRAAQTSVKVRAPAGLPPVRQESIDLAVELYGIDVPASVIGPHFDGALEDRGLTSGGTVSARKTVTIGPSAFSSWGVLGSTLGHEVEVHARQSFLAVVVRDRLAEVQLSARRRLGDYLPALAPSAREAFDNDGTWRAEREAYLYELKNAGRFGLSPAETRSIRYVMNYYYPETRRKEVWQAPHDNGGTFEDSRSLSNSNEGGAGEFSRGAR